MKAEINAGPFNAFIKFCHYSIINIHRAFRQHSSPTAVFMQNSFNYSGNIWLLHALAHLSTCSTSIINLLLFPKVMDDVQNTRGHLEWFNIGKGISVHNCGGSHFVSWYLYL